MSFDVKPSWLDDLSRAAASLGGELAENLLDLRKSLNLRPLIFRRIAENRYLVGDPDNPATFDCDIQAAPGAHMAMLVPGRSDLVPAARYARMGAAHAANSVRTGIGRLAAALEQSGQYSLASEVRRVRVVGGYLVAPPRRRVNLIVE